MIIFVTDEGRYWNHENPILEKYADCVVVVCLNGKKVTDKYRCVVSPYKHSAGLGMTDYSVLSHKYKALESIREELRYSYAYHDDIVFLTDAEPQSLYPYLVLKDEEEYNNMHLWCMSPFKFEGKHRKVAYEELLYDIDKLTSLHYVDGDKYLENLDKDTTMPEIIVECQAWLNSMLPGALFEIANKLEWSERYYYDLKKKRYISTNDSYSKVVKAKPIKKKQAEEFVPIQDFCTLGLLMMPDYPDPDDEAKEAVQQLHPRLDGKAVCERLKTMRQSLADENGIKFQTVDCPSSGPCAGTCERCDMEIRYLADQMSKIKEEDRKYPEFKIGKTSVKRVDDSFQQDKYDGVMGLLYKIPRSVENTGGDVVIPDFLKKCVEEKKEGEADE